MQLRYHRASTKTGVPQTLQFFTHLWGQSLQVSSCILFITDPTEQRFTTALQLVTNRWQNSFVSNCTSVSRQLLYINQLVTHHCMISVICASQWATLSLLSPSSFSSSSSCLWSQLSFWKEVIICTHRQVKNISANSERQYGQFLMDQSL